MNEQRRSARILSSASVAISLRRTDTDKDSATIADRRQIGRSYFSNQQIAFWERETLNRHGRQWEYIAVRTDASNLFQQSIVNFHAGNTSVIFCPDNKIAILSRSGISLANAQMASQNLSMLPVLIVRSTRYDSVEFSSSNMSSLAIITFFSYHYVSVVLYMQNYENFFIHPRQSQHFIQPQR